MTRKHYNELTPEEKKIVSSDYWNIIKESIEDDEEATEALKILRPSLYSMSTIKEAPRWQKFTEMFNENNTEIDELELFKTLYIGRGEARLLIREALRKEEASNKKWIEFDSITGVYRLVSTGPITPISWKGYVPEGQEV